MCEIRALVEQFLSQALGKCIAEAIAEIQPGGMTAALAITAPCLSCYSDLLIRYWLDLNLGTSQEQVQMLAASFSRLTFEHDCGLQKSRSRYSPRASSS